MSEEKPDELEIEKQDGVFVVSKICHHVNRDRSPHKYSRVAYTRAELEQLVVEAKKMLEEK